MIIFALNINEFDERYYLQLSPFVDSEKMNQISKFLRKEDRYRSLAGQILVRYIIINNLRIENNHIIFKKNQFGKPYLDNYKDFKFNISHGGHWAVCGADYSEIGIDVQEVIKNPDSIASKCLTEREFLEYNKLSPNKRIEMFHTAWTMKESYIKYKGKGLSIPMNKFEIDKNLMQVHFSCYSEPCYFKEYLIEREYKLFVCSNSQFAEEVNIISIQMILDKFINSPN